MTEYTKVIGIMEQYFVREFVKIKHHKNKVREISEHTVAKAFLAGDARVTIYFEESEKEIILEPDSNPDDIRKYLGKRFIK